MKLKNVNGHLSELPETHRPAIVGLIDLAVEANMDKVLEKLNSMQAQFNGMQMQMNAKFDGMQMQMDAKFNGVQMQIEAMQRSNDAQISSIKWTIVSSFTICSLVLGIVGLVITFFPS